MANKKTLLMVVNVDWFLISHRLCIAKGALKEGWRVIVVAKDTGRAQEIRDEGIEFINIPLTRSGTKPVKELMVFLKLVRLYKEIQPTIIHQITLKPIIYGSIITRFLKIKAVVNAISGLGFNFTNNKKGWVPKIMKWLLRVGFSHMKSDVIFQNKEDYIELKEASIVKSHHKIHVIKGSGVNLTDFECFPEISKKKTVILFAARMLWNKGIKELKQVTDLLKATHEGKILFVLCGIIDNDSKDAVPIEYLKKWEHEGYVTWLGHQENMAAIYKKCDIVVFPSYREGMPKTLLEACAIGRPIVTTNANGCRDCVEEGENGYIVAVKSVEELKHAILKLVDSPELRAKMGIYGRKKAEREFNEQDVIKKHLEIYNSLSKGW